jgi:signal transduction histidine kinase
MHSSGWVGSHPGGETAAADDARFRAILGHCPRCIAVLDLDGRLVGYNREFAALFATPPRISEPIAALFDERPRAMVQAIIARAGTTERAGAIVPMRTPAAKDGDVEFVVATLPGDGPASIGVILAADDRTADKECNALTHHLATANRDGAIALAQASLCHDISNALTAATLCLTTLEHTGASGSFARDAVLEDLGEAIRHANDIVRRARSASSFTATKDGEAQVRACIESAMRVVEPQARAASVRLTSSLVADAHVAMSATELTQVLTNLVTNSVHAIEDTARPGEVKVTVAVPTTERVTITVLDDGPGIEPAFLLESFEAFQTTRAARGGTGLGLAIARGIIESAGGRIDVLSTKGRSTEMRIELPVVAKGACSDVGPRPEASPAPT